MWLPIEQAPKDGTGIDIWDPFYGRECDVYWDKKIARWRKGGACFTNASHFMYRSDPPPPEIKFELSEN